jgi:hypothetical protein
MGGLRLRRRRIWRSTAVGLCCEDHHCRKHQSWPGGDGEREIVSEMVLRARRDSGGRELRGLADRMGLLSAL